MTVLTISITGAPVTQAQGAPSTKEKLDRVESKLEKEQGREEVLTVEIEKYDGQISAMESEVSGLRQQESVAESELEKKQGELDEAIRELKDAVEQLENQRQRLKRALTNLRENLVATYMAGTPDLASIALAAEDYGDLVASSEYLEAIQNQTEDLASRVRDLRNEARASVEIQRKAKSTIESARDEIASREAQLETTRVAVESRQSSLSTLRLDKESLLGTVRDDIEQHEEIAADLRSKIQSTIAEASSSSSGTTSSAGNGSMIWPIEGTLSSPFGPRWGRIHEGLDISAPGGTPIKAAASGTVILMQSEAESGGYGLFTCVDHGGGLSTCYAHQSTFGTSVGAEVSQGDVIGNVGNTGNSFGDHLHFETRVDGFAQDPLGYL
ncbi:MAG TPA: peptidoglycan DD-metalloendopeptidase family protein [Solirubrobacterales bacterium]|nr:peptidoglycan DD-metalloendopeptidase family protein [Solirubrobacterales bacterium]